ANRKTPPLHLTARDKRRNRGGPRTHKRSGTVDSPDGRATRNTAQKVRDVEPITSTTTRQLIWDVRERDEMMKLRIEEFQRRARRGLEAHLARVKRGGHPRVWHARNRLQHTASRRAAEFQWTSADIREGERSDRGDRLVRNQRDSQGEIRIEIVVLKRAPHTDEIRQVGRGLDRVIIIARVVLAGDWIRS